MTCWLSFILEPFSLKGPPPAAVTKSRLPSDCSHFGSLRAGAGAVVLQAVGPEAKTQFPAVSDCGVTSLPSDRS